MWKILIILMLPGVQVYAQAYYNVAHLTGSRKIHGIDVTVTKIGNPLTGGGTCGVNDYWIGYTANNGYDFNFAKPVSKLRLRLTEVNRGEVISFSVNGEPYVLSENEVYAFNGNCFAVPKSEVEDGKITCHGTTSNAEVIIAPQYPINSLRVYHTNGKKMGAGTVFDLAIVDETSITANGTTGINNLNLQPGMFYLQPNPADKMVNLAFLPYATGTATVTITDMAGRKVLVQPFVCTKAQISQMQLDVERFVPGNYMVELFLGEEHYIEKLVKL